MHARIRCVTGALVAALTTLTLAACGSQPSGGPGPAEAVVSIPAAEGTTQYPLELATDYGTTTLEARPERVVVIGGLHDLEAVLALDVVPVMANDPTGWPWLVDAGGDQVEIEFDVWAEDGLPFEEILAARPDVIVAATYGELETDYDKLAAIAPVVAMESYADAASWEVDWRDLTRTVASALDLSAAGDAVIADSDALVADTAAAHPEWAGTTTTFLMNRGEDAGLQVLNTAGSPVEALFGGLGFAAHPNADAFAATEGSISVEQIELLDADTLVVAQHGGMGTAQEGQAWLEANQLYRTLPVVESGHVGQIQPDASGALPIAWAFSYPNALSIEYIVTQLTDVYGDLIAP